LWGIWFNLYGFLLIPAGIQAETSLPSLGNICLGDHYLVTGNIWYWFAVIRVRIFLFLSLLCYSSDLSWADMICGVQREAEGLVGQMSMNVIIGI
jgi:hypothetical protein